MAILDRYGNSIETAAIDEPQTAKIGYLRHEVAEHPSRGLTPSRLAMALEHAERGDLRAQLDLFEDMEEKDGHIYAELSKRRMALVGLDWFVLPGVDASAAEQRAAEAVEEMIRGLEFEDILLDMAAAIGQGYACLEIEWARQGALWLPKAIRHRPARWLQLPTTDPADETLRLRDGSPDGADLHPGGWIVHVHKARSAHLSRAGLGRVLAWPFLFKNYSVRDMAEFLEIYGLPLRLGTYSTGASDQEKATLLRAVLNIGHAAGGIVPEGMAIDFHEASKGTGDPFMAMVRWCESTVSKAVLGGTLTSQTSESGGGAYALGNVHNEVRHDILTSDARQMAQTLSRDLVWPLTTLNGLASDPARAPRLRFDTRRTEDLGLLAEALPKLVDIGVRIPAEWAHEKLNIPRPTTEDEVLGRGPSAPPLGQVSQGMARRAALRAAGGAPGRDAVDDAADKMETEAGPRFDAMVEPVRRLVMTAGSLEEVRDRLYGLYHGLPSEELSVVMGQGLAAAELSGRFALKAAQTGGEE